MIDAPLINPRHFWLRERTKECVEALMNLELKDDWQQYRFQAKCLAEELLYTVMEWEKYYK